MEQFFRSAADCAIQSSPFGLLDIKFMNGTVDFDCLLCCCCCWTVPAALKKRVLLMTETCTTAERGCLCCASLELLACDVFFLTWALQSQRRELFVLHPALRTGSCLLLPAALSTRYPWLAAHIHSAEVVTAYATAGKAEFCWRKYLICVAEGNICVAKHFTREKDLLQIKFLSSKVAPELWGVRAIKATNTKFSKIAQQNAKKCHGQLYRWSCL